MYKKIVLSSILLTVFFILFYYINFSKKHDYYYYSKIIHNSNISRVNQLKEEFSVYLSKDSDYEEIYKKSLSSFLNKLLNFQKNIIENNYPTLQILFNKYKDSFSKSDYVSLKKIVDEMKNIIRDSSLNSETKISLYTQIREFTLSLEDLLNIQSKVSKKAISINSLISNKFNDFLNSVEDTNALAKLNNFEEEKIIVNVFLLLILLISLGILYYDILSFKNIIRKEKNKILVTCDAIKQSFNTEVLLKLKSINYFNSLKNNLYETLKVFNNKIDYYKDLFYYLKIPFKYKEEDSVEIKNKAYVDLETEKDLKDFFILNDKFYKKYEDSNYEYYNYIDKDILLSQVEKEILYKIEKNDTSKFSNDTRLFFEKLNIDKVKTHRYFSKYLNANRRLRKIINTYRSLNIEHKNLQEQVKQTNNLASFYIDKKNNLKVHLNKLDYSINNLKIKLAFEKEELNNFKDTKSLFNSNIKTISLLKIEFGNILNKLDAIYKNININNLDCEAILELKGIFTKIIADADKLKQTLLTFSLSIYESNRLDFKELNEFGLYAKDLNDEVENFLK